TPASWAEPLEKTRFRRFTLAGRDEAPQLAVERASPRLPTESRAQFTARLAGDVGQHLIVVREVAFELLANRPRQRRARCAGRHGDGELAASKHRGQGEIAVRRVVGG